jgi:hypothetical protein
MNLNKLYFFFYIISITLMIFSGEAYCQGDGLALLVQVSPPGAGVVTPEPGVHRFGSDSSVNLSATPNEGYQFVYWLGDAIEPTKMNTLAYIDSPKIIVAVFAGAAFDSFPEEQAMEFGPGYDERSRSPFDAGRGGFGGLIRRERPSFASASGSPDDDVDADEEEEAELPVPEVPEPATVGTFILGSLMVLARRKRRQH